MSERKRWNQKSRQYRLRKQYVYDDRLHGRECTISSEEIRRLIEWPCFYCGTVELARGLDRVDNSIGHTIENVVPCCVFCNGVHGRHRTVEETLAKCSPGGRHNELA
jgi:hypothetical protein